MDTTLIREVATAVILVIASAYISVKLIRDGDSLSAKRNAFVIIMSIAIFLIVGLVVLPDEMICALREATEGISA